MFDWTKPTAQMLGRFQPWHDGHTELFKKALEKTGQVVIMLRTTVQDSDNPYSIDERVMQIAERLTNEHITTDYYTIISVPNISSICYGRAVGYTIDEIKLDVDPDHEKDIVLDDNYTLRLKYPSLGQFIKSNFNETDVSVEDTFELVADCIDQVFSPEESFSASDCTKKELNAFLEQLNSKQFKKIEKFFETMPKLKHTIDVVNPKTQVSNHIVLEGLSSFFD